MQKQSQSSSQISLKQVSTADLSPEQRSSINQLATEMQKNCYRRCQQKLLENTTNLEIVQTETLASLKLKQSDIDIYKEYYDRNIDFTIDDNKIREYDNSFRKSLSETSNRIAQKGFSTQIGRDGRSVQLTQQKINKQRNVNLTVSGQTLKGQKVEKAWTKYSEK